MGVVVDEDGVVYVSDRKAGKVFEITDGKVETLVRRLEDPVGLAFDSEWRLLIVEEDEGRLLRLEDDGKLTVLAERMKDPRWVTVAEDGTIYLSAEGLKEKRDRDRDRGRNGGKDRDKEKDDDDDDDGDNDDDDKDDKKKHKTHGEIILRLTTDGELSIFANGFKRLEGLAINGNSLFAAARGLKHGHRHHHKHRRIHKHYHKRKHDHEGISRIPIAADGSADAITRFSQTEIEKPLGLVRDALGALYVSGKETKTHKRRKKQKIKDVIVKIDSDGAVTHFASRLKKGWGDAGS